jgi:surfeit locus 1 family protein
MTRARFWIVSTAAVVGIAGTFALGSWQLAGPTRRRRCTPPSRPAATSRRCRRRAAGARRCHAAAPPGAPARHLGGRSHRVPGQPPDGRPGRLLRRHAAAAGRHRPRGAGPARLGAAQLRAARGAAAGGDAGRRRSSSAAALPRPRPSYTSSARPAAAPSGKISTSPRLPPRPACACCPSPSWSRPGRASQGLLREWPRRAGRGPETNYGYAAQWWALSALIAILYAWYQFILPRRRAKQA